MTVVHCAFLAWSMGFVSDKILLPVLPQDCESVSDGIFCNTTSLIIQGLEVEILHSLVGNYSLIEKIDASDYRHSLTISSSLLSNFFGLRYLRLHHCNIVTIETGAFRNLSELRTLEISGNSLLRYNSISDGLQFLNSPLLYMLNISGNHNAEDLEFAHIQYEMFEYLSNTSLTVLDISWARLSYILAPFYLLSHLEVLNMTGTFLTGHAGCLSSIVTLENLTTIALDHWPKFTRGYDSIFPWDEPEDLYEMKAGRCQPVNFISERGCFYKIPNKLRTILLRFVDQDAFFMNTSYDICVEENNIMNYLLTRSKFSRQLGVFYGYHRLKLFDISFPDTLFTGSLIKANLFHDMPSLMTVRIPGTGLNALSLEHIENLFVNNKDLTNLDISFNKLTVIPFDMFVGNKFIETLNASNNQLREFNLNLSNCNQIRTVDLTNNRLKEIDVVVTRHILSINGSVKIYLGGNVLNCECHLLDFFLGENIWFDYKECIFEGEWRSLHDITPKLMEEICSKKTNLTLIIIGVTSGIAVIVIIFVVTVWKLRKRNSNSTSNQQGMEERPPISVVIPISNVKVNARKPKFVVFLAYSSLDSDFVVDKIYLKLNEKLKFILPHRNPEQLIILYDKHFLAGIDIDEICRLAILESHVTVAVVTENFLNSPWCNLEVKMAMSSKVPLLPLFVSKFNSERLTGFLRVIYDEKVRLVWPDTTNLDHDEALEVENDTLDVLCSHIIAYVKQNSYQEDE